MKERRTPRHDVAPPNAKRRVCLKCGKLFPSQGEWNRICPKCHAINSELNPKDPCKVLTQ